MNIYLENIRKYAIIAQTEENRTDAYFTPFIAAYGYNPDDGSWASGHYFQTLRGAVDYARRDGIICFDRLEEIATYLLNNADEELLESAAEELEITKEEYRYFFGID